MCFQCLKEIIRQRAESKRNRDFAKKQKESPRSETTTEAKSSETKSD